MRPPCPDPNNELNPESESNFEMENFENETNLMTRRPMRTPNRFLFFYLTYLSDHRLVQIGTNWILRKKERQQYGFRIFLIAFQIPVGFK